MKKIRVGILLTIITALFLFYLEKTALAGVTNKEEKANPKDLEKIEFIHYKRGFAKGADKGAKQPSCIKFLTPQKSRWSILPVSYIINPTNPQGLSQNFVGSEISTSVETWDMATPRELMADSYTVDRSVAYGVQDFKNAIVFGNYSQTGVIAVTSIWINRITGSIAEFDIMFDTDWGWGDATKDSAKMDLQNIATHEFGHAVGLGDVYQTACNDVTMYGYSSEGEIDKRTLEAPDIAGLLTLYP